MVSYITAFKVAKWIYFTIKHVFLGNKSLDHYWETKRKTTLLIVVLLVVSIFATLMSIVIIQDRGSKANLGTTATAQPVQEEKKKETAERKEPEIDTATKHYSSQEHADFVLDYFSEINQREKKN